MFFQVYIQNSRGTRHGGARLCELDPTRRDMDLHSYPQSEHGRFEQILNQFLLKSLHIILDSRVPANKPSSLSKEIKKSDKWFNLALGDRPTAMDSLSFWNRTLMEPMIIDIILVQESSNIDLFTETVVERWVIQYEPTRANLPQSSLEASHKKTYKKSIILLRSVYSMLRLLPAYKAFRKQNSDFEINYKISSFSSPFSQDDDGLMRNYKFTPVDAQQGCLSVSVAYREDLSSFNLDAFVSCPLEIITDYVGSPLAEPMRSFPSNPTCPTSFTMRGKQSSPLSFQRPHSWTSGIHKDASSHQQQQPFSGSPPLHRSPYEYSPSPSPSETYFNSRSQNQRGPTFQKLMSTPDELLSPPFSSSPTPSPPTYMLNHSRPMSIPHLMVARSPRYISPNLSDPNRHSLPPLSPRSTKYDPSSHESSSGSRSMRRYDSARAAELSNNPINVNRKLSRDSKEDSGRFSSLLSSSSSPRVSFSRSSSRLSFQDDFGDSDFSCPFIVDDVDPPDTRASVNNNLDGQKGSEISPLSSKKSQDAAVGALVHMLRSAPPLRQDSSCYASKIELEGEFEGGDSDFLKPRKTSDALEELKVYREMKDLLLSKSAARVTWNRKTWT